MQLPYDIQPYLYKNVDGNYLSLQPFLYSEIEKIRRIMTKNWEKRYLKIPREYGNWYYCKNIQDFYDIIYYKIQNLNSKYSSFNDEVRNVLNFNPYYCRHHQISINYSGNELCLEKEIRSDEDCVNNIIMNGGLWIEFTWEDIVAADYGTFKGTIALNTIESSIKKLNNKIKYCDNEISKLIELNLSKKDESLKEG